MYMQKRPVDRTDREVGSRAPSDSRLADHIEGRRRHWSSRECQEWFPDFGHGRVGCAFRVAAERTPWHRPLRFAVCPLAADEPTTSAQMAIVVYLNNSRRRFLFESPGNFRVIGIHAKS